MSRKYFGTDGVRGRVGEFPITPDFALKLGWAAGQVFSQQGTRKVLIGKDTRISGYMLESALEAGLAAAGINASFMGPMPTPAVAYLTRTFNAEAGIVISASHNPYHDNGIKFFSAQGTKLPDEVEHEIEAQIAKPVTCVESAQLGKASRIVDAAGRYIEFCKSTFPSDMNLKGLKIVVDCANGATYHIAPNVFKELGAEVIAFAVEPDGLNINAGCGATDTKALSAKVLEHEADLGIAFDGDGDRVMMIDHLGHQVDGDELMFIIAAFYQRQGLLKGGIVGTQMTNLAFEQAVEKLNIPFVRAKVGDRYVMEQLLEHNWMLGGENSGHIICLNHTTTGDGIVSALQVLAAMRYHHQSLREQLGGLRLYPQILINVRFKGQQDPLESAAVLTVVAKAEQQLGQGGRVLLRKSGTEPLLRVMVEGDNHTLVERLANEIADEVRRQCA
ncbi:phosphoglucosamine mutase [Celerinatantimonas diazotrophica]|uniref:Phosphoglucosamine mutase n=1 Tax=Celerinatantimonas diazotrophica TaxID=412034 RepID=A0A4R1K422_9GAMM|nr:phosphoglucosamine mutase [Celerinatantimonas diazotrophica]TCK58866.1 phosphoglucosamine mutase [Celerinatantimonas diazotrophica]CAG9297498.1 Phosphoglucosamine mutase [Celerinatantimonas diazotrophica]